MRLRNQNLGFIQRLRKLQLEPREYKLYSVDGIEVRGTYCIEEDTIDTPDLLDQREAPAQEIF
jgi:hypothetical protein